uniref:ATP synthase F(1) complex subunit gamma, mitochondrial n=1 Tax=Meleagris gallopavo TaxID=9103 RepID=A0A803XL11_MELGA
MRLAIAFGLRKSDFPMALPHLLSPLAFSFPDAAECPRKESPQRCAHARGGRADLQRSCAAGAAMFARGSAVLLYQPQWGQVRNMATLKDITRRLKSIKNIQKITKSMKMVSAAKYARAERELKPARVYGTGALALYEKAEIKAPEDKKKHLLIGKEVMVVGVGDKIRGLLQRTHGNYFLMTFKEVGRRPPSFGDASIIASELLNSGYEFDEGSVIYNRFRSVISYKTDEKPIYSFETVAGSESLSIYDDIDADVLRNYQEFTLANILYYSLKESTTSEQSARMTAMDNASKNASEMIDKLTLTFNRTRQAVITKELIEIISGAAALD